MAVADTARLLAELDFVDKLSPGVKTATSALGGMQKSARQTELEISKLQLASQVAASKAAGTYTAQAKAVFAQRKATIDAGIAQEKYNAAVARSARSTAGATVESGKFAGILGKVKGSLGGLSKQSLADSVMTGAGIGGGILAFNGLSAAVGTVIGVFTSSVEKAKEEQAGIERLNASLTANIAGYNGNRDAIEEVIASREKLAFSDGEQRDSLSRLLGITHDVTKALDLQREAMDLARLKGIDLSTASDILGKVYGGNVSILTRYGIQLGKGATATEALAAVQKMAAGQAEAYSKTAEGATTSLQIAIDDLQEELGTALLPVIKNVAMFTRDVFVPALTLVVENGDKLTPVVEALALVIGVKLVGGLAQSVVGFTAATASALQFGAATATVGTEAAAAGAASAAAADTSRIAWASSLGPLAATLLILKQIQDAIPKPPNMQQNLFPDLGTKGLLPNPFENATAGAKDFMSVADPAIRDVDRLSTSFYDAGKAGDDARARFLLMGAGVHNLAAGFLTVDQTAGHMGAEVRSRMLMAKAGVDSFAASSPGLLEIAKAMRAPIDAARAMRSGVDGEFKQLLDDFDHFKSNTGRIAELAGQLLDKKFRQAIHDGRPDVKGEAEAYQLDALHELQKLVAAGGKVGKDGMKALEQAMRSENPEIATVATLIKNTVAANLPGRKTGHDKGDATGKGFVAAVNAQATPAGKAAAHIARLIEANLPDRISTTINVDVHYRYPGSKSGFAAEGGFLRKPGDTLIVGEGGEPEIAKMLPGGSVEIIPFHKLSPTRMAPPVPSAPQPAVSAPWAVPYGGRFVAPQIDPRPPRVPIYLSLSPQVQAAVTVRSVVEQPAIARRYGPIIPNDV